MLHKASNSKEETPYCFPRSSIKYQGHTGQNITDFDPNWAFPNYRPVTALKFLRFALFSRSYIKFQGHTGWKIDDLDQICPAHTFIFQEDIWVVPMMMIKYHFMKICQYPTCWFHASWYCRQGPVLLAWINITHWVRDKMATIFQTILNAFSWMEMYEFRLRFHWSLFLRVQLTIFQHWFR